MIAFDGGDEGEADAGVAAGGFDDGCAGLEEAFLLGVVDHRVGDAVFDAAQWVEVFEFGDDVCLCVFLLCEGADLEQRCVADEVGEFLSDFNHDCVCFVL